MSVEAKRKPRTRHAVLQAMVSHSRLVLACELVAGERSVEKLATSLVLARATVSQHLSVRRRGGVDGSRREARAIHYRISDPRVQALMAARFEPFCVND